MISNQRHNCVVDIYQGIHSYMANMVRVVPYGNYGEPYNQSIDYKMYHVKVINQRTIICNYAYYNNNYSSLNHKHMCLLIGHLPAGTTYYVNNYGEVVSDALEVDLIRPFYLGARY